MFFNYTGGDIAGRAIKRGSKTRVVLRHRKEDSKIYEDRPMIPNNITPSAFLRNKVTLACAAGVPFCEVGGWGGGG